MADCAHSQQGEALGTVEAAAVEKVAAIQFELDEFQRHRLRIAIPNHRPDSSRCSKASRSAFKPPHGISQDGPAWPTTPTPLTAGTMRPART